VGPRALSDFELTVGMVFGLEPGGPRAVPIERDPIDTLGDVLEPHLRSGSCVVWQTGDEGGAIALACAVRRARREGLPDPLPLSLVTRPGAGDDPYVRSVVDALGLDDWMRVDVAGQLGLLGRDAREGLLRHGIRYPCVAHVVAPAARAASGGTLVDCHGLREVWDFWRGAAIRRLSLSRRPTRRELTRAAVALAPRAIRRRAAEAAMRSLRLDHLREPVLDWLRGRFVEEAFTMPLRASSAALRLYQRRCLWETARTFSSVGEDNGAHVIHFFMDPRVVGALADTSGWRGWPSSGAMLAALVPEIPARTTPAPGTPSEPFWQGAETESFIAGWDGSGLDERLVDPPLVREAWRRKDTRAGMLLQAAWLASGEAGRERAAASPAPAPE
jgi:hypothetical protein